MESRGGVSRVNRIAALSIVAALSLMTGCRQDMHDQPKFYPQRGSSFYADGRSVRPQVNNTVGRSQLHEDSYFYTGLIDGKEVDGLPFKVTPELLARGQERYNVYCTPCHSRVGNGAGMIVQRGYYPAGNLQGSRLRGVGLGHFFTVISNGYGAMPDYSAQIKPIDRWAIAAYIRALQLSQNATRADVPSGAHVKPLTEIAAAEGLPESYAGDWEVAGATSAPTTGPAPSAAPAETPASPATPAKPGATPATPGAVVTPPVPEKKVITVADAKAGLALYQKNCQLCHQPQLTGMPPTFPSLIHVVSRVGEAHVRKNITQGASPMPAFPNLSTTEVDNLVKFLTDPAKAGIIVGAVPAAPSAQ